MKKRFFLISLVFILFASLYYLISSHLFCNYDYIHSNLIFFAQKAMLAKHGIPARLENISFFYPPISFLPFLLLNDPIKISSIISALISTIIFVTIFRKYQISKRDVLILVFFFFNPLYLFLSITRYDVLLFYFLFSLGLLFFYLHLITGKTFYSFLSGLFLGFCFYLDFRIIFVLPIMLVLIFISKKDGNILENISSFIVISSPLIFFFLSWVYLNYLFMSDGFLFLKNPHSFIKSQLSSDIAVVSSSMYSSLVYMFKFFIENIGIILPYIIQTFFISSFKGVYFLPFLVIYTMPLFFYFFSIYSSTFFPYNYSSILLNFTSIFFYFEAKDKNKAYFSKIMFLSFLVSFLYSFIIPLKSLDLNERFFANVIIGRAHEFTLSKTQEIEMSNILKKFDCKKILSDDLNTFEVVFFNGDIKRFILPYNYEFNSAVSNPYMYVDCVLLSIYDENLKRNLGKSFDYFSLVAKTDKYLLYRKTVFSR